MTEYLPILAMGGFGLVIAIVGHFSLSRERKALLEARARLAEEQAAKAATGTKAASVRDVALSSLVLHAGLPRNALAAAKQYRRVKGKV